MIIEWENKWCVEGNYFGVFAIVVMGLNFAPLPKRKKRYWLKKAGENIFKAWKPKDEKEFAKKKEIYDRQATFIVLMKIDSVSLFIDVFWCREDFCRDIKMKNETTYPTTANPCTLLLWGTSIRNWIHWSGRFNFDADRFYLDGFQISIWNANSFR